MHAGKCPLGIKADRRLWDRGKGLFILVGHSVSLLATDRGVLPKIPTAPIKLLSIVNTKLR
jgi:hypothetical protein